MQVGKFPESRCLAIKLPNFGTLSIMNAVYRAYPFLIKEARRKLGKEQADQAIVSSFHLSTEPKGKFLLCHILQKHVSLFESKRLAASFDSSTLWR